MNTFLLTWNPKNWDWGTLTKDIQSVKRKGKKRGSWSVGLTKKIREGDRIFLMKLGEIPRGIIGSGWVQSEIFSDLHWDVEARQQGKQASYVYVDFDTLLDSSDVFPIEQLEQGVLGEMHWTPQSSGVLIPAHVASELERIWAQYTSRPIASAPPAMAEELEGKTFREGTAKQIIVNAYERNAEARMLCLKRYGILCAVCGFDFKDFYGEIGEGFIHVHHLKAVSEIGKAYELNPIKDLRPVCPNCHAMLHKRKPAFSIEELRALIRKP